VNSVKRKLNLSREAQAYIKKIPYNRKVLKEAKKRDNVRSIEKATNKTKKGSY